MNKDLAEQIRTRLAGYLSGKDTLRQFRDWFDVETWGLAAEPDSPARQLGGEIELRIAEYTNGHLPEAELRSLLQAALQRESVAKR